jgi:hypothetical protein
MPEKATSDIGVGGSLLFGFLAVLGALVTGVTAYLAAMDDIGVGDSDQFQIFSGLALTVALVAGGIAIAVIHLRE